jgi:glycosyltransferase involved in cell wall biosynthesis
MRILWVSEVNPDPNSGAGGTELLMVEHLRRQGHSVETIWETDLPRRVRHGNLHYAFELPQTYAAAILKACDQSRFDVVTVNLGQSYLAAKRLKRRGFSGAFVVRSHGLDDHLDSVLSPWEKQIGGQARSWWKRVPGALLSRIMRSHLKKAAQACDGYVVSNSLDAAWLQRTHRLTAEKIAVIPQAPAAAFLQNAALPMTAARLRRLLYVANYHFAKGPYAVAKAVTKLLTADPMLEMTWICHPADHDRVRSLLDKSLVARVRLLGWMSQNELVQEFDEHGVFLYPSLFDGFGKVFLEAMSRGLCVIGTRAGGMVDLIRDGENGCFCEFNSPEEMVSTVVRLLHQPELACVMSEAAAMTARQHTWDRVGSELGAFFRARLDVVRPSQ